MTDKQNAQAKEPGRKERKKELFLNQKRTLDLFLERGAISRAQYDKSLGDLIVKMGIKMDDCGPESEIVY